MTNKNDRRYAVRLVWIISFILMWFIFNKTLPRKGMDIQLIKIEDSITNNDWNQAKISMNVLKNIYKKNEVLIQANNATEILQTFDYTLGQLDASIQNENDSALDYIGGLKASIDYVMEAFPGP